MIAVLTFSVGDGYTWCAKDTHFIEATSIEEIYCAIVDQREDPWINVGGTQFSSDDLFYGDDERFQLITLDEYVKNNAIKL